MLVELLYVGANDPVDSAFCEKRFREDVGWRDVTIASNVCSTHAKIAKLVFIREIDHISFVANADGC